MITYFVHSTSRDNEVSVKSGWSNPLLSELGLKQAEELRQLVKDKQFDFVFTSDLQRAVKTAEIVFPDAPVKRDERLREMNYGLLNGQPGSIFPENPYWCIENRFEQGECCLDVQERIEQFLSEHYEQGLHIAVVAHRYPQLAFEVIFNKLSWPEALDQDWRKVGVWQASWTYD